MYLYNDVDPRQINAEGVARAGLGDPRAFILYRNGGGHYRTFPSLFDIVLILHVYEPN